MTRNPPRAGRRTWPSRLRKLTLGLAVVLGACASSTPTAPPVALRYVGSSTIAVFLREAGSVYRAVEFEMDTVPESEGGERAILRAEADLAGVAMRPKTETRRSGIQSTLVGRDAIAVVVHADNPVEDLSLDVLRRIFTGQVENWSELGGNDVPVTPLIVGEESATRTVFRAAALGDADYDGCREVRPDADIVTEVARDPGAIGQISFSFLSSTSGVTALAVDGEIPSVTNFGYPIARPLYLLWRKDNPAVQEFVRWALTEEGQRTVMRHFVGVRVTGSVGDTPRAGAHTGTLVVHTDTDPVYDGGMYYYPHRPYLLLTRHGEVLRRVPNHRSENDESPMQIELVAGTYLIRPVAGGGDGPELFVTIRAGSVTEVDVRDEPRRKRR